MAAVVHLPRPALESCKSCRAASQPALPHHAWGLPSHAVEGEGGEGREGGEGEGGTPSTRAGWRARSSSLQPPCRRPEVRPSPLGEQPPPSVSSLVASIRSIPPRATALQAADMSMQMEPDEQHLLTARLCSLVQQLGAQYESERAKMIEAQHTLAQLLERLVTQESLVMPFTCPLRPPQPLSLLVKSSS